jgi:lactoylglutathione lyase
MSNGIQISGFGINVDDLDRAADFYTGALGLQEKGKYDLGEMHEVLVGGEHDTSPILLVKHANRTEPPDPGTGFEKIVLVTDDIAGVYERALAHGGTSDAEPRTQEKMGIKVALVRDPDGYLIELIEPLG